MLVQLGKVTLVAMMAMTIACGASLPTSAAYPRPHEQAAIESAIQSWQMANLPWAPACQEQLARIRVVVSGPEEFTELCGRRPVHAGGKLYACNTEQFEQQFPFMIFDNDRIPLLVISRLQPAQNPPRQSHRRSRERIPPDRISGAEVRQKQREIG